MKCLKGISIAVAGACLNLFLVRNTRCQDLLQPLITKEGIPATAPVVVPTGRVELFNGKDFTGWTFFTRDHADLAKTWSVENGVVHSTGKPTGYLRTETGYRNYKLTVEWRFVKVAPKADNGGVLVHIQLPDKMWPPCIQCQGKHDALGDLFLMGGAESKEHLGKDANTALPKHGESAEKPVGEWNTTEMVCDGTTVKVYINGKLMNETTDCTVSSGKIGLQCEGAEFEVRKMLVEPLK
jgi:hypothetical protein